MAVWRKFDLFSSFSRHLIRCATFGGSAECFFGEGKGLPSKDRWLRDMFERGAAGQGKDRAGANRTK